MGLYDFMVEGLRLPTLGDPDPKRDLSVFLLTCAASGLFYAAGCAAAITSEDLNMGSSGLLCPLKQWRSSLKASFLGL